MIIVQTPVRISFVGGGTDFKDYWSKNGGAVVSSSIDKYVYAIVKQRFDDQICVNYTRRERVQTVDDVQHDLVREAMRITGVARGVEITTLADIPSEGSGLGSSSSITVALLHALFEYRGVLVSADQLARAACRIEIDILGAPIGIQDQYIAAYGGFRHFVFKPDGSVGIDRIELTEAGRRRFESNLRLFYLNKTRNANDILKQQQAAIADNLATLSYLGSLAEPVRDHLLKGEFDAVGKFLHEAWVHKRQLADNISSPQIDAYYEAARDAGALGGKVTGAGAGGFLLIYCPLSARQSVIDTMGALGLRELPFRLSAFGSRVIFSHNSG